MKRIHLYMICRIKHFMYCIYCNIKYKVKCLICCFYVSKLILYAWVCVFNSAENSSITTKVSVFPQLSECCGLLRNIGQNYPPNGIFYVSSRGDSHRVHAVKISQPRFNDKQTDGFWSQLGHAPVTGVYFNRQKIQWLHSGKKPPNLLWSSPLCGR